MFVSSTVSDTLFLNDNELYTLPDGALDDLSLDKLDLDNNFLVVYPGNALATLSLQAVYGYRSVRCVFGGAIIHVSTTCTVRVYTFSIGYISDKCAKFSPIPYGLVWFFTRVCTPFNTHTLMI